VEWGLRIVKTIMVCLKFLIKKNAPFLPAYSFARHIFAAYSNTVATYDGDQSNIMSGRHQVQFAISRSMIVGKDNYDNTNKGNWMDRFGNCRNAVTYTSEPRMDFSQFANPFVLKIHLGIRNWAIRRSSQSDEYAREIFQVLTTKLRLRYLHVILEVAREQDWANFKTYYSISPYGNNVRPQYPMWLTTFHVEMPALTEETISMWKMFLDLQTRLKTLICNFGSILWTFYQSAILRNSRTLQRVTLRRVTSYDPNDDRHYPLDWSVFSSCNILLYLKVTYMPRQHFLFGNHFIDERTDFLSHENFAWLPPNILEVHLGMFILIG